MKSKNLDYLIVVWGVGKIAEIQIQQLVKQNIEIKYICDNNAELQDTTLYDIPVISPETLSELVQEYNGQIILHIAMNDVDRRAVFLQASKIASFVVTYSVLDLKEVCCFYDKCPLESKSSEEAEVQSVLLLNGSNDSLVEKTKKIEQLKEKYKENTVFTDLFQRNMDCLRTYPYLFFDGSLFAEKSPYIVFQMNECSIFMFHRQTGHLSFLEIDSQRETKYFFESTENPFFVEEEYNIRNLRFLRDNVRNSHDVGRDNHIYLAYGMDEDFLKLLHYCDLSSLLSEEKFVILVGSESKKRYPIDFVSAFGIDYKKMPCVPLRLEEVTKLVVQMQVQGPSGTSFAVHLAEYSQEFKKNLMFRFTLTNCEFLRVLYLYPEKGISSLKHSLKEGNEQTYFFDMNLIGDKDSFLLFLEEVEDEYKIESFHDLLVSLYHIIFRYTNRDHSSRLVPSFFFMFHCTPFLAVNGFPHRSMLEGIMESFHRFNDVAIFATIRDPLVVVLSEIDRYSQGHFSKKILYRRLKSTLFSEHDLCTKHEDAYVPKKGVYLFKFEDWKLNPIAYTQAFYGFLNLPLTKGIDHDFRNSKDLRDNQPELVEGYSVKALYKDVSLYFTEEEVAFIEMLLYPYYEMFGYKPLYYDGKKLTEDKLMERMNTPFLFEETINPKNCTPYEVFARERDKFIAFGVYWNMIMSLKMKRGEITPFPLVKGKRSLLVNEPYTNLASLPKVEDRNSNFLNAEPIYRDEKGGN